MILLIQTILYNKRNNESNSSFKDHAESNHALYFAMQWSTWQRPWHLYSRQIQGCTPSVFLYMSYFLLHKDQGHKLILFVLNCSLINAVLIPSLYCFTSPCMQINWPANVSATHRRCVTQQINCTISSTEAPDTNMTSFLNVLQKTDTTSIKKEGVLM